MRIFNTYGPNMHPNDGRVVSNFIVQALRDEDLTIYGDGSQTRSFQYIDDLVEGMVRMMNNEQGFVGPVNLGNPVEFTIRQLAEKVLEMIPASSSTICFKPLPGDDPRQRCPDIALAKRELGWEPKTQLAEGLQKTIEYFRRTILELTATSGNARFPAAGLFQRPASARRRGSRGSGGSSPPPARGCRPRCSSAAPGRCRRGAGGRSRRRRR